MHVVHPLRRHLDVTPLSGRSHGPDVHERLPTWCRSALGTLAEGTKGAAAGMNDDRNKYDLILSVGLLLCAIAVAGAFYVHYIR